MLNYVIPNTKCCLWFYLNIITGELYKKNYAKAREYLALVSVTTIPAEIYYIHFNLRYLKPYVLSVHWQNEIL